MNPGNEKYRALFRREAGELTGRIGSALLALETDASGLDALRRDLHTLKGSARLVGLVELSGVVHDLEDFVKDGSPLVKGQRDAVDLALEVLDAIEGLAELGKPAPEAAALEQLRQKLKASVAPAPERPPPAPEPPVPPAGGTPGRTLAAQAEMVPPETSVRVDTAALDRLLALSGELLLQQGRMSARFDSGRRILALVEALRWSMEARRDPEGGGPDPAPLDLVHAEVAALTRALESDMVDAGFVFHEIRTRTTELRLQPFRTLYEPLERQLRAEARQAGKKVRFEFRGGAFELDQTLLDQLKPVLTHTLTNALVHGIEDPEARRASGKPEEGTVAAHARPDGNRVRILIEDDGRGLDPGLLRKVAVTKGLISAETARQLGDEEAMQLIFAPGFSTARVVSRSAGRGVGMDAVRASVERLRGQIHLESERGRFTRIVLLLPASLGVVQGVVVAAAGEQVVLPLSDVVRVRRVAPAELAIEPGSVLEDGVPIPVGWLADLCGWGDGPGNPARKDPWLVVLRDGPGLAGLLVDRVLQEHELVLKHPGALLGAAPFVGGVTIFPTGEPGLVLRVPELTRALHRHLEGERPAPAPDPNRGPLLLVDDSLMALSVLKAALEAAGYRTETAADGRQALERFEKGGIGMVVTDFEMPVLDGLGLVSALRQANPTGEVPIVVVSTRAREIEEAALDRGADAVVLKGPESPLVVLDRVRHLYGPP